MSEVTPPRNAKAGSTQVQSPESQLSCVAVCRLKVFYVFTGKNQIKQKLDSTKRKIPENPLSACPLSGQVFPFDSGTILD